MNRDMFEKLLDELDGNSINTLKEKNARYSSPDDCLHNFNAGGDIFGGTAAEACWGYLTKHLVALRDMVKRNDFSNREDFLEKCQDSINYIRFLWCIGNEGRSEKENIIASIRNDNLKEGIYMCIDFKNGNEAHGVFGIMWGIVSNYGYITLADIYDLIGITISYDDTKIIWTDLMGIIIDEMGVMSLPMPDKFK